MSSVAEKIERDEAEVRPVHRTDVSLAAWEKRCARVGICVGIVMSILHLIFTLHWNQGVVDGQFRTARIVISTFLAFVTVLLLVCWRSRSLVQFYAAFVILPVLLALYSSEVYASRGRTAPGTAALQAGRTWDSRNGYEVIRDLRQKGKDAFPLITPTIVSKVKPRGFSIDGSETLPLGGISNKWTTLGNETGKFVVYYSDEHGFNNPPGTWGAGQLDLAVVGSSFAQGAYVSSQENLVAHLRERYPRTLNLGMLANGPLIDLAEIKEYLPALRPRIVLWIESDVAELPREASVPVLMSYLQPGFHQGLMNRQQEIDRMLTELVPEIERRSGRWPERWPTWLASRGWTREVTPLWMQDLVMGEDAGSLVRIIRLEQFRNSATYSWIYPTESPDRSDLMSSILGEAQKTVASWGGKLYFVHIPSYEMLKNHKQREAEPVRASILDLARSLGIATIDLRPKFQSQANPLALFAYPNSHYNEDGYSVAANGILEALARN